MRMFAAVVSAILAACIGVSIWTRHRREDEQLMSESSPMTACVMLTQTVLGRPNLTQRVAVELLAERE